MSFASLRSKNKKKQTQKQGNVVIVRSLLDVRMPTADDTVRQHLEEDLEWGLRRFSRSETDLDCIPAVMDPSEVPAGVDQKREAIYRAGSLEGTRGKFMRGRSNVSHKPTASVSPISEQAEDGFKVSSPDSIVSPLSLELPQFGPPFAIESTIFENIESITKDRPGLGSMSSSQEAFDRASSCYSQGSPRSSITSAPSVGHGCPRLVLDAKRSFSIISPVAAGVFDDDDPDPESNESQPAPATTSVKLPRIPSDLKNKPLPPEPPLEVPPLRQSSSVGNSPQSMKSLDERRQTTLRRSRVPTLSQAADDLENHLAKLVESRTSSEEPPESPESPVLLIQDPKTSDEEIAPLDISAESGAEEKQPEGKPDIKRSSTPYSSRSETASGSHLEKEKKISIQSATSTDEAKSPDKRKFRFALPVRGLARKASQAPAPKLARSLTQTDADPKVAAKNMQRHIETQISLALNPDEGEGESDAEWSTLLPLKAVKQLGIPLMSSSHIPRLSSSATERSLRLQLPRLQTGQLERPVSHLDGEKAASEPGSVRETLFIDSPIEEGDQAGSDENKIVVGISKIDYLFPDTSTQEAHRTQQGHPGKPRSPLSELNLMTEVFELDAGVSSPVPKASKPSKPVSLPMPPNTPDEVILALMRNVGTFDELFNCAMVNRQFFRVFKANELSLMKAALFKMSPPAWELREMSPPWGAEMQGLRDPDAPVPEYTPALYLRHHARDIFTLVKLKSLILVRCGSFLRPETVRGLAGVDEVRAGDIDEAFWRIWTFCRIFGSGKNRENDIHGQMDWLNGGYLAEQQRNGATVLLAEPFFSMNNVLFDPPAGFGRGNGSGLSPQQLYDMTEIWNCFGVLLQAVHAKCDEARKAGIFDNIDIPEGDLAKEEAMLEEWTYYVLTLGPSALVSLASVCPTDSAEATFRKAKQMGLTKWEPPLYGASRASFLREAVSRAYESRFTAQNSPRSAQAASRGPSPAMNNRGTPSSVVARSSEDSAGVGNSQQSQPRHSGQLSSDMNDQVKRNPGSSRSPDIGPTSAPAPAPAVSPVSPQFIDPVDKAMKLMVDELGFSEYDAKWALKMTDTGDSIDADAAVRLLMQERKKRGKNPIFSRLGRTSSRSSSDTDSLVDPLRSAPPTSNGGPGWRWA